MGKIEKLLKKVLSGKSDNSIPIARLKTLLLHLGFEEREGEGSHTIFSKQGIPTLINLQEDKSGKAKNYQVRQVRKIIIKYQLFDHV